MKITLLDSLLYFFSDLSKQCFSKIGKIIKKKLPNVFQIILIRNLPEKSEHMKEKQIETVVFL